MPAGVLVVVGTARGSLLAMEKVLRGSRMKRVKPDCLLGSLAIAHVMVNACRQASLRYTGSDGATLVRRKQPILCGTKGSVSAALRKAISRSCLRTSGTDAGCLPVSPSRLTSHKAILRGRRSCLTPGQTASG